MRGVGTVEGARGVEGVGAVGGARAGAAAVRSVAVRLGAAPLAAAALLIAAVALPLAAQEGADDGAPSRDRLRSALRTAPEGARLHRGSLRALFALEAATPGAATRADSLFREYAAAYGERDPLGLADMAVRLSRAWLRDGDPERAAAAVEAPTPPEDPRARALLDARRAELALHAGAPDRAADLLRGPAATAGTDAARRARWIALLGALEAADPAEARAFGSALRAVEADPGGVRADELLAGWADAPESRARPSLLSLLADALDAAGRPAQAAEALRRLADAHPASPEAAAALLALGRRSAGDDPAAARAWLERLVLGHPDSPAAPEARRLLERLPAAP